MNSWNGGTIEINALTNGYKLLPNSPAKSSGRLIADNGGFYFYGNTVSASVIPNMGMSEGTNGLNNKDFYENKALVYPNPVTNNKINVIFKNQISGQCTTEIYSLSGKLAYKTNLDVNQNVIKINPTFQLSKGIYLLKLINDNTILNHKIISK